MNKVYEAIQEINDYLRNLENENKRQAELIKDLKEQIKKLQDKPLKTVLIKSSIDTQFVVDKDEKTLGTIITLGNRKYWAIPRGDINVETRECLTVDEAHVYIDSYYR